MTERVGTPLILRIAWLVGSVGLAATVEGRKSCMGSPSDFLLNSMVSSRFDGIDLRRNPGAGKGDLFSASSDPWLKLKLEAQPNDKTQTVSSYAIEARGRVLTVC